MKTKTSNIGEPLVSVITPCYNGEEFVHRFLDSILKQTYNNMELIFINDGSIDKTEEIVLSYRLKFEERNIDFKYIYQENKGQAAALNQGLKIFKGEYLTWPDSDDILHKDNLKEKVTFLQDHPECGMVMCKSRMLNEENLEEVGELKRIPSKDDDTLFSDLINEKNVYFTPGGYMVRSSCFLDSIPSRRIFESRGGQNWQILLPIAYKYKCGYIDKYLYDYLVRADSHSRQEKSLNDLISKCNIHQELLINVIESINEMPSSEKQYWFDVVEEKYDRKRFVLASNHRNLEMLEMFYLVHKENHKLTIQDRLIFLEGKYNIIHYIISVLRLPLRLMMKITRVIE